MIPTARRCLAAIGVAIFVLAGSATAADAPQQLTAGELADFCRSRDIAVSNACRFFILGVVEGAVTGGLICLPDGAPIDNIETLVRAEMARDFEFHPADKELPAVALVLAPIRLRYPCGVP